MKLSVLLLSIEFINYQPAMEPPMVLIMQKE